METPEDLLASDQKSYTIPTRQVVAVEHPCIVHNLDRAIASLGGPPEVNQFLDTAKDSKEAKPRPLHVSLRPEDIYATSVPADEVDVHQLVLQISVPKRTGRKRKRGSDSPWIEDDDAKLPTSKWADAEHVYQSIKDNSETYSITPVAEVRHVHKCIGLPMFQHTTTPFMKYMRETLLSKDYETLKTFTIRPDQTLPQDEEIQPPPPVRLMEVPFPYDYRQNAVGRSIAEAAENAIRANDNAYNGDLPLKFSVNVISPSAPAPTQPPSDLKPESKLEKHERDMIDKLRKALQDRPVMTTRVQLHVTGRKPTGHYHLRKISAYIGYVIRGGPFKDALIRYGVDPRTDPKYRIYQQHTVQLTTTAKKRYGPKQPKEKTNPRKYIFDGQEVYTDGRTYQICDVTDPFLAKLLADSPVLEEYEPTACGWFKTETWSLFRTLMKDKIDRVITGTSLPDDFYQGFMSKWVDDLDNAPKSMPSTADPAEILMSRAKTNVRSLQNIVRRAKGKSKGVEGEVGGEDEYNSMPDDDQEEEAGEGASDEEAGL